MVRKMKMAATSSRIKSQPASLFDFIRVQELSPDGGVAFHW